MKIILYWPDCNLLDGQWVKDGIDSYWVECTYEEAKKSVFPYLSPDQIGNSKKYWDQRGSKNNDTNIDIGRLCYLVSKDLKSIVPFPWYYPYSGQWNGYCPFIEIKELNIKELRNLSNIFPSKV